MHSFPQVNLNPCWTQPWTPLSDCGMPMVSCLFCAILHGVASQTPVLPSLTKSKTSSVQPNRGVGARHMLEWYVTLRCHVYIMALEGPPKRSPWERPQEVTTVGSSTIKHQAKNRIAKVTCKAAGVGKDVLMFCGRSLHAASMLSQQQQ